MDNRNLIYITLSHKLKFLFIQQKWVAYRKVYMQDHKQATMTETRENNRECLSACILPILPLHIRSRNMLFTVSEYAI